MKHLICVALTIPLLGLAGCGKREAEAPPTEPATATAPEPAAAPSADAAAIDAAIANPNRVAADKDQDSWRRPAVVLNYLELRPGMRVIDYMSAGGYYTELVSLTVGPEGHVIAYNNEPYLKYAKDEPVKRYANNRLANVAQLTTPPEDAPLEPASLDAALFVQSYHDLHWKSKDGSWPTVDPAKALAKLAPALRPGAVVVVVDHIAAAGSDPAVSVDTLHRIDPDVIKRDFEAAGLAYEGESTELRNPADDHTKPVFDDSIRRKTDQVIYKFRKK